MEINEKLLLNLLYVLAAIVFWLLPALLRYLKRRREREASAAPTVEPEVEIEPEPEHDPYGDLETEVRALVPLIESMDAEAAALRSRCTGPWIAPLAGVVEDAVAAPCRELRQGVDRCLRDMASCDALRTIEQTSAGLMRIRAAISFLGASLSEHADEGFAGRHARGTALARAFHDRLVGLLKRGKVAPSDPLFIPVMDRARLHAAALSALAPTRAVPFDGRAALSGSPLAWLAIARDLVLWTFHMIPDLEPEMEQRYAALLEATGYQASLPPGGLARETFLDAVCGLFLGPLYVEASAARAEGPGAGDVAARALELAGNADVAARELSPALEIMLHVLLRDQLDALSSSRVVDDMHMLFDHADASRVEEAAGLLASGKVPDVPDFHVIVGAMRAALKSRGSQDALAGLVDRALGVAGEVKADVPGPVAAEPSFLGPAAVREAIVVGALLER